MREGGIRSRVTEDRSAPARKWSAKKIARRRIDGSFPSYHPPLVGCVSSHTHKHTPIHKKTHVVGWWRRIWEEEWICCHRNVAENRNQLTQCRYGSRVSAACAQPESLSCAGLLLRRCCCGYRDEAKCTRSSHCRTCVFCSRTLSRGNPFRMGRRAEPWMRNARSCWTSRPCPVVV